MAIRTILGASSTDLSTLQGSAAHDQFNVESSNLYIQGLKGDDTISGNSAVEQLIIDSGADDDWLIFNAEILASSFNLGIGNDQVEIRDFSGTIPGG